MDVYLNGTMVSPDKAVLPVDDAGLQHAVGLFETMLARNGHIFRLDQHLERLARSAHDLGLARDVETGPLADAVMQTLRHNQLDAARLRLTVTPGSLSLVAPASPRAVPPQPTVIVTAQPPTEYDPAYFEKGVMVLVAQAGANPFDPLSGHKTLSYWSRLRALRQAAAAGAGEAIWLNVTNHLASGAVSNVFVVRDGALFTPFARGEEVAEALRAPVLPGVTRAAVIELAEASSVPVQRQMLSVEDLLEADEIFLTNSSWLILPVTQVERRTIGDGSVGPVTRHLRERLLTLVEHETKAPA